MSPIPPSHALLSGLNLAGRLTFGPRIGVGTQSEIYRAESPDGRHAFAVKIVRAELATDPKFVGRFVREVRTLEKVQSPHVAKIVDYGVFVRTSSGLQIDHSAVPPVDAEPQSRLRNDNEIVYLVFQWIDAEGLEDRLRRTKSMSGAEVAQLALGVLDVLESAHRVGLVHREVNPSNLLVADRDGALFPWLIDFGVVQTLSADHKGGPARQPESEQHYTSPETARNEAASPLADLWGLGVTLFYALTGKFPHAPAAAARLMADIGKNPPRRLAETDTVQPISAELAAFVDELLEFRPSARLSTAQAARQRLARCPEAHPQFDGTLPTPRPRPVAAAAARSEPLASLRALPETESVSGARTAPKGGGSTVAMPAGALEAALADRAATKEVGRGGSTLRMAPNALEDALAARGVGKAAAPLQMPERSVQAPAPAPVPGRAPSAAVATASAAQTMRMGAGDLEKALAAKASADRLPALTAPAPEASVPAASPPTSAGGSSKTLIIIGVFVAVAVCAGVAVWLLK